MVKKEGFLRSTNFNLFSKSSYLIILFARYPTAKQRRVAFTPSIHYGSSETNDYSGGFIVKEFFVHAHKLCNQ